MVDPQLALDTLELVLGPLEILLAALVYWAAPRSTVNRILAVLLLLEGLTFGGLLNASESFASPRFVVAAMAIVILDIYIAAPLYLLFITYAIHTPVTHRMRGWPAIIGCAGLLVALSLAWAAGYRRPAEALWATLVVCLIGLGLAIWYAKRASTPTERRRAHAYLAAFVLRDAALVVIAARHILSTAYPASWVAENGLWISFWASVAMGLFPIPLVYGLLQGQLLDLDRRIKLRRSISAGSTLVIVLLVPLALREVALNIQSPAVANALSLTALAILLLGLGVLWRTTNRVAARLVPTWDIEAKKIDVYKAALAQAGEDEASQRLLQTLRSELGLSERDHALLLHSQNGSTALAPGSLLLGRFHVLRSLDGSNCFLADDHELRRKVVIKKVHARLEFLQAMAEVHHPNVVSLYDMLRLENETLMVMESLQPWSAPGTNRYALRRLATDVFGAVDALHQAGVVHGDIHPRKLLMRPDGTAVLGWPTATDKSLTLPIDHDRTAFLSPERRRGGTASIQDDLWGAAATVYHAWIGQAPGQADPRWKQVADEHPAGVPDWLQAVLDPDAKKRPKSAREMLSSMGTQVPPPPMRPASAGAVPT